MLNHDPSIVVVGLLSEDVALHLDVRGVGSCRCHCHCLSFLTALPRFVPLRSGMRREEVSLV